MLYQAFTDRDLTQMSNEIRITVDGEDGTILSRNPGIRFVADNANWALARVSLCLGFVPELNLVPSPMLSLRSIVSYICYIICAHF